MIYIAVFTSFTMALVALIHFYWALGGRYGLSSAGPIPLNGQHFTPSAALIFAVACLMLVLAMLPILLVNTSIKLDWLVKAKPIVGYMVGAGFIVRAVGDFKYIGFFKRIYNSRFSRLDTAYFSPLICLLGCSYCILA